MAERNDLEELDVQYKQFKVFIKRSEGRLKQTAVSKSTRSCEAVVDSTIKEGENLILVHSPLGGIFYRSPGPGSLPFVEVGDMVSLGQTLCIIEAMKTMNEIASEVRGEIKKIVVENGQPVEPGQILFHIKPT